MKFSSKYFILLCLGILNVLTLGAQSSRSDGQKSLDEFQRIASAEGRFEYFFDRLSGYGRSFEGDWKRVVSEEYQQALAVGDTLGSLYYGTVLSRVLLDKGEPFESLRVGEKIRSEYGTHTRVEEAVLATLYEGYRSIGRIDELVDILRLQKSKGYSTRAEAYEIYEESGDYTAARHAFVNNYVPRIKGDTLERVFYYNKLGWYRIKLRRNLEDAKDNLAKAENLLAAYREGKEKRSLEEQNRVQLLETLNTAYTGWLQLLGNQSDEGADRIRNAVRNLGMADDPEIEKQRVELVHVLVNYLQDKRYYSQMGRYLRSVDGKGSLSQQQRNCELLSEYYYQRENYRLSNRYASRAFELNNQIVEAKQQLINYQSLRVLDREASDTNGTISATDPQESFDRMKLEQDRILGLTLSLVLVLMGFVALVFAYVKSVRNSEVILEQKKYIEKSLKEKESLLKEIHHRVRNNLQMVSSLLSLQTKNTRDQAAVVALEEGKSRVKAMALIHQKLYQNDNLSSVGMQEYIESLVKSIQQVYKRAEGEIEVRIDARGTELDIDQAIPIGLILNELVSNSFKHAFPHPIENPSIQIQVTRKNAQGYFEYSDNGVGLPDDSEHKSRSSMGIRLINRLVNQLQSQLNTDRSRAGVRFWFTF